MGAGERKRIAGGRRSSLREASGQEMRRMNGGR